MTGKARGDAKNQRNKLQSTPHDPFLVRTPVSDQPPDPSTFWNPLSSSSGGNPLPPGKVPLPTPTRSEFRAPLHCKARTSSPLTTFESLFLETSSPRKSLAINSGHYPLQHPHRPTKIKTPFTDDPRQ